MYNIIMFKRVCFFSRT